MKPLIYLFSLLAPRRIRTSWREEWLAELTAARRAGLASVLRLAIGAPFDALSSRWTTRTSREARGSGPWRTDLKQTVRSLMRSPGHVTVVALCLGVGIAVSTTTFSILNAFTSGEMPGVTDRARIARLHLNGGNSSLVDYEIIREGTPSFVGIAAEGTGIFAVRVEGHAPMNIGGAFVSGNYFDVLGTRPHLTLGRLLQPFDDRPDAPLAVVISHAFWSGRLGAPADILQKSIVIGGRHAVITGVAPEAFRGLRDGEMNDGTGFAVYLPLAHVRGWPGARSAEQRWLNVYGRLTGPMDADRLTAELQPIAARIESLAGPSGPGATNAPRRNAYIAVTETWRTPDITTAMTLFMYLVMLAAPVTVLAIGSANVANLQLVRASLRMRELAMRVSLGASRGQIIRLLTFEAVLLVVVAFTTAAFGIWILLRLAALVLPVTVPLDGRVMLFGAALAVLIIGATGLVPGFIATRSNASAHLRSGGRTMASGNSRLRRGLVVAQVTLCFLLLLVAGFFVRGFVSTIGDPPPYAAHTLIADLRFDVLDRYGPAERRKFLDEFDGRMRSDGRVRGIGYTDSDVVRVWRAADPPETRRYAETVSVGGDYFDVSRVRVLRGRALTKADAVQTPAVMVNEAFIAEYQLVEPVVGQDLRISFSLEADASVRHVTIVGVTSPQPSPGSTSVLGAPKMYLPLGPSPLSFAAWISIDNAALQTAAVRRIIADLDPELPVSSVHTLEDSYLKSTELPRKVAETATGLGIVSLLLAVSGLYSVIAFFVALRTSEFGIRVALGARSADIVRMVLRQALWLAGVGLGVGLILGVPLLVALNANFPFTTRFDPMVILPPALALALTALVAGWVPARRAASIQASEALRAD